MREALASIDWQSFWMNVLFFLLGIIASIKLIPYFTLRQLRIENKKFIVRKLSSAIQEICAFLNSAPFKDGELNQQQVSIFTKKGDLKNYRYVGLVNINVYSQIVYPKIILVVAAFFKNLEIEHSFEALKMEELRIRDFREKLEIIIATHSLHVEDETISRISEICLDIRSFEIYFQYNYAIDDLIESGKTKRLGVFGVIELAHLYEKVLKLLRDLLSEAHFETQIRNVSER